MNLARIHDKYKLKKFWEQKIERHSQLTGNEESRMKASALSKLREEWLRRLKFQNQHQESFYEERIRRAKQAQHPLKLQN